MKRSTLPTLAISSAITFGLFYTMQGLVAYDEVTIEDNPPLIIIDNIQDIPDNEPETITRDPIEPPEMVPEPENIIDPIDNDIEPTVGMTGLSTGLTGRTYEPEGININAPADGDYLPLVRVQPQYPRRAQQRGIEGHITVSLTVNEDGTVSAESVKVLEEDPKGYFATAAKKAAAKFKYKPKIVNGAGQKVYGVTYKFSFNLSD